MWVWVTLTSCVGGLEDERRSYTPTFVLPFGHSGCRIPLLLAVGYPFPHHHPPAPCCLHSFIAPTPTQDVAVTLLSCSAFCELSSSRHLDRDLPECTDDRTRGPSNTNTLERRSFTHTHTRGHTNTKCVIRKCTVLPHMHCTPP
jgi:hypothetical protein